MREISGQSVSREELLVAAAVDRLSILIWQNTEDGHNGRNKPRSIVADLTEEKQRAKYKKFATGKDFAAAWDELTKG